MELYPHTHPENTTTATTPDGPHWPPSVEGPLEKQPRSGALGVIGGSTAELIAARELLRRWIARYAPGNKPGGWDYDKNVVELIETSAALLGIEDPWRQ